MPKCICEICTCGRHRCPHNPTNHLAHGSGPCKMTEYKNVYKPHPIEMRSSFKPNQAPMQGGEFSGHTTNRADYKQHPVERPYQHQPEQYVPPQGQMDGNTSYKQDYPEKHGPRAQAIRHDGPRQTQAKFEGEPTYQHDYKRWEAERAKPINNQAAWVPPTGPFGNATTVQDDYRSKQIPPRESFKPANTARISDDPFPDKTTQRDAYIPHPLEKRFVREKEVYRKPSAQLEGLTTNRRDYQGHPGGLTQSCKPEGRPFQSDAPFEEGTTNRADYKKWPTERPYQHQQEPYQKPAGQFEGISTHKAEFTEKPIDRARAMRPASSKRNNAPFEGISSYTQEFQPRKGERAQMPRQQEYQPNNAPFEGNSTYQQEYVGKAGPPRASFRPSNQPLHSDAPLDDRTNYRTDYLPKPIQPCEAAMIDQPTSRYRFAQLDQRGHKLYTPVHTSITRLQPGPQSPMQNRGPVALSVA